MAAVERLDSAEATVAAGRRLAAALLAGDGAGDGDGDALVIYLHGDLGAGKTTFARGFIAACGHTGRVPSPTYTLVEPYDAGGRRLYHIDLYRLSDPGQVDELALQDLDEPGVVMLIEWPERGADRVARPDLELTFAVAGAGRTVECVARTVAGKRLLAHKIV